MSRKIALQSPRGLVTVRVQARSLIVATLLVLVGLVLAIIGLSVGDFAIPFGEVVKSILGTGDPATAFVVETLRGPRAIIALLVGAAFGASGAIFQSLTANPLGSPDVIGFTYGSASGGLFAITVLHSSAAGIAACAVAGGLLTAVVVYALAFRDGVQPFRLVLVGLGVGYTVLSLNWYLITRASLSDAYTAQRWMLGSLNSTDWTEARVLAIALVALSPLVIGLSRPLRAMEVGDDTSRALGISVERNRALLAAVAVILAAAATATAGPIAFVALAAPQIARRLTAATGPNIVASALTGAVVLIASDLIAREVLPNALPVGLVTGLVGGAYLAWLLTRRKGLG